MTYAFRKITWARASWRLTACVLLFSFMSICAEQANAQPQGRRGGFDPGASQGGEWGPGGGAPNPQLPAQPQEQKQDDKAKKPEEKVVELEKALKSGGQTTPIVLNQNDFRTSDGAKLQGTYYKGKADKDTPVVIVLPSLVETQENYADLCKALATAGYAVLCVDLRGRGKSEASNFNMGMRNNNPPNDAKKGQKPDLSVVSNDEVYAMIDIDRQLEVAQPFQEIGGEQRAAARSGNLREIVNVLAREGVSVHHVRKLRHAACDGIAPFERGVAEIHMETCLGVLMPGIAIALSHRDLVQVR